MKYVGRPNTIRVKDSLYRNWIEPYLAADGSNLDAAIAVWEADLQPGTVKSLLYLAKEEVPGLDISAHVRRIGRSKQQLPPKALTKQEIVALTAVIEPEDTLYLAYHLALNTGMRRGEVMGLRFQEIDMLRNRILVCRSFESETKSGKSRYVPISSPLEKIIVANPRYISYNSLEKKRKGNFVKSTFDPNPLLKRSCREAGVREITFHSLRHTFATLALEAGRSPVLVSKVLGHSKVSTTLDLYWSAGAEALDMGFLE
jgi:integrase